jgi:c-di-GMP-binding flagellar brake protein YcgR
VARLFLSNDKEVVVAVCRDVSIGGMQVLTDHVPGEVGTVLKLNVSPAQDSKAVKGFVAEGEIVRVLEDGRGFSFRFTRLSEDARKAIGAYVKAGG